MREEQAKNDNQQQKPLGSPLGSGLALYYSGSWCRFPLWPAPYESNTLALFIM